MQKNIIYNKHLRNCEIKQPLTTDQLNVHIKTLYVYVAIIELRNYMKKLISIYITKLFINKIHLVETAVREAIANHEFATIRRQHYSSLPGSQ